ncbi:MAG TPA: serine/threonine-protein kinase [Verrucomicrobiae bacterium]|jgi:hypothetical protein|nr:serine/threonine-protein kinase [Verrucomicrobiae bacterium]
MPDTTSVPTTNSASTQRVDRLEVLQELGRGSIGVVQKAKLTQSDRVVALRQFSAPQWLDDVQELLQRIVAEAKLASALQHPNIAKLYTCGYKDFTVFMTSEFVDAPSVKELMASRQLTFPEIQAIAKQLCAALDYAHSQNTVHQNLNPANLKFSPDGTLKVLDFGLLKSRHLLSQTPAKKLENEPYLSPEEVKGKPVDKSTNLFTAATILYELFTTRNPFGGKHLGEVDRSITEVTPHALTLAHPRVPEAVSRVIMKGLSKAPADRFQSGEELASALDAALKGVPARIAAPPQQAARPAAVSSSTPAAPAPAPAQAAPMPDIGGQTIRIPRPVLPAPAKTGGTTTTTSARAKAAAPVVKARFAGQNLPPWMYMAGGGAILLVVVALAFVFLRPKAAPPETPAPTQAASSQLPASPENVPPPPIDPVPVLEVHEIAPKPAKAPKAARTTIVPAASARAQGEMAITSVPAGATIMVEGSPGQSWRSPQVFFSLTPGVYKVTVSLSGYATETRAVTVSAATRTTTEVRLSPLKGVLTVSGNPAGARITIDGRDMGRLSPSDFMLDPGSHQVVVSKEGYLDSETAVRLAAGQSVAYSPTLRVAGRTDNIKTAGGLSKMFGRGMVRVEIRTDPKGADILINGVPFNKTTPVDIQMEPGNYDITLKKDGYKPVRRSVIVAPGERMRIDETLSQ